MLITWLYILDEETVARQITHPAHINNSSLSSFIPFCQFGDDLSVLGRTVPQFRQPVCSAFQETVLEGQVCYQLDVNTYRARLDWRASRQFGLGLLVDTNQELDSRAMYFRDIESNTKREASLRSYVRFEDSSKVKIHLHTLGGGGQFAITNLSHQFFLEPIVLYGGGNYAMTGVKYISVSEEFLQLDLQTRNCQMEESLEQCKNRKYHQQIIAQCDCLPFSFKHLVDITVGMDLIFIS